MTNYKQPGKSMAYAAGANISSGDVVVLGDRIGVALTDIASGATGTVELEGVYELTSDTGTTYSQGDMLFWDAGNSRVTKTASGNTPAGIAHEAKSSAGTTALVRLQSQPKRAANVADASSGSAAEINALRDALVAAGLMKSS